MQQIVDNEGNPINLTTADGQQIKVITNTEDGQETISGLLPDGTLVPINLNLHEGKGLSVDILTNATKPTKNNTAATEEVSTINEYYIVSYRIIDFSI